MSTQSLPASMCEAASMSTNDTRDKVRIRHLSCQPLNQGLLFHVITCDAEEVAFYMGRIWPEPSVIYSATPWGATKEIKYWTSIMTRVQPLNNSDRHTRSISILDHPASGLCGLPVGAQGRQSVTKTCDFHPENNQSTNTIGPHLDANRFIKVIGATFVVSGSPTCQKIARPAEPPVRPGPGCRDPSPPDV